MRVEWHEWGVSGGPVACGALVDGDVRVASVEVYVTMNQCQRTGSTSVEEYEVHVTFGAPSREWAITGVFEDAVEAISFAQGCGGAVRACMDGGSGD